MYLKRLTLRGFKSFASATTMIFEPGITCIVGPNGSGKSNVVDALAWVMGEQGPKHLRGGSMEDVIFAGTAGRAALGRAEVVLTIDNADQALPIDYTEVTIARTKFRNGASEYAINGTPCRLLDVRELLSDSGMGREMHVIVGQGQLDAILQATPESRRGLIEEAAGVLKHRERKDKALRKLDATESNLHRLTDLVSEIRRQLKPLGRQAEVARRAGRIQADVRDAKARLLADDLVQATSALEAELAEEAGILAQRAETERRLAAARTAEETAQGEVRAATANVNRAQETWYALSGQAERVRSTLSLASERIRHAEVEPELATGGGRDPETLEAQAAETLQAELALRAEVAHGQTVLDETVSARQAAEVDHAAAEAAYAADLRAEADRREGLARLGGQVAALRGRVEAADDQMTRHREAVEQASRRADEAEAELAPLEGETGSAAEAVAARTSQLDTAKAEATAADKVALELEAELRAVGEHRAGLAARAEALRQAVDRVDASARLAGLADERLGVLGPASGLLKVKRGFEAAVSAALGPAVEAVAIRDLPASLAALDHLKADDLGRAGLLVAEAPAIDRSDWPALPQGTYAFDCVTVPPGLQAAVAHALERVVVVDTLASAQALVTADSRLVAVTRAGDVVSAWFASGGSDAKPSPLQTRAALDETEADLAAVTADLARLDADVARGRAQRQAAGEAVGAARRALDAAKSEQAAWNQRLSLLRQASATARNEADRIGQQLAQMTERRDRAATELADLDSRWERARSRADAAPVDAGERDRRAETAKNARAAETEARLRLRTLEERARSLADRAEALRQSAAEERAARAAAAAARAQLRAEAAAAQVVRAGAAWLAKRVEISLGLAAASRARAEDARERADEGVQVARQVAEGLTVELEAIVDSVHRDEVARAQQRMRIEALAERAQAEVGIEAGVLISEYGPLVPIPLGGPPGDAEDDEEASGGEPLTYPYVREEQLKRLRAAERDLQVLGKINPLALEEFEALQERHTYLSEQLEDLKRTRTDLLAIVEDVDARVQEVFAAAYADVERAFAETFARLFPGGEGRLYLTEPGQWLTTGVDVEARPAGKTVKRLSLLSGGERSLVAICFLVALFKARPSPFYILDEVEAALDDTNLGRLLGVYEELRDTSQLLVITHQKRTMEIADTLYGVSMRDDGISKVVSQRLRDD